jgi:hypothetical protein
MSLSYEEIERRINARSDYLPNQLEYTYITGNVKGRNILIGPFASEESQDCRETIQALNNQRREYNTIALGTRNRAEATRILRARKLRSGVDIAQTLQRVKHSV